MKKIEFDIDLSSRKFEANARRAEKAARAVDDEMKQLDGTIKDVDKRIDKMDGKVDVDVSVDTGAVDKAESKIKGLEQSPQVSISDRTAATIAGIEGKLRNLQTLSTINLALNVADYLQQIENLPLIGTAADQLNAERILSIRGEPTAAQKQTVEQVYGSAYGESREEVARTVNMFTQAGVPDAELQDAVTAAYDLTTLGLELNEVFRTQQALVKGGLADSYREAADLIAAAVTGPAGAKEDVLDTMTEYSNLMTQAGLTGEQFVNLLNTGVEAGAWNTDKIADAIKEGKRNIDEAVAAAALGGTTAYGEALSRVEYFDEAALYASGQMGAEEFWSGLIAALQEKGNTFDYYEIFGSPAEDLGVNVINALDFSEVERQFDGTAANIAATMKNTIGTAFTELTRVLEQQLLNAFNISGSNLTTWVDGAKEKIFTLTAELRSGTALPDALEIALEAPGLANSIRDFESTVANLLIEFIAALGNLIGIVNPEAGAGIGQEVARLGAGQFAYDIQYATDEQQAAEAIRTAMRRGVSVETMSEVIGTVVGEIIAEGAGSQAAIDQAMGVASNATIGAASVTDPANDPFRGWGILYPTATAQDMIDRGVMPTIELQLGAVDEALTEAQAALTPFTGSWSELMEVDTSSQVQALETVNNLLPDIQTAATDATEPIGNLSDGMEDAAEAGQTLRDATETHAVTGLQKLLDALNLNGPSIKTWLNDLMLAALDASYAMQGLDVSGTPSRPPRTEYRASGGPVSAGTPYVVGERGMELFVPAQSGTIIPHNILSQIMGMGGTSFVTVTQNVYTGNAGATAATDRLARHMAGYL